MTDISREMLKEIRAIVDPNYFDVPGRKRLYEKGFRELPHLPELAMQWFMEIGMEISPLERELWFAKRRPEDEHLEGLPPWAYYEDNLETPPLDEIHRGLDASGREAEAGIAALQRSKDRAEELRRNKEAALASLSDIVPDELDDLTGEERNTVYRMLRLQVTPTPEGYDASGVLMYSGTHTCG